MILALMALATVNCGVGQQPTPSPTPGQRVMVEVAAPIDQVDIRVAESNPPQYSLHVVSGLPNGCVTFDRYEVDRQDDTIMVKVINLEPGDKGVICTEVYGRVEHNIALGTDFVSGRTYAVLVNDVKKTFVPQ